MERLIELIDDINNIESLFQNIGFSGVQGMDAIYNVQEFQDWIQEVSFELQKIKPRDEFITNTIKIVQKPFIGWDDRKDFNIIKAKLLTIKKNVDTYFPDNNKKGVVDMKKQPKIFISHSSKDKSYVEKIVNLLDGIGLSPSQVFCSSLPGYGIPIDTNIFDYLRTHFQEYNLHVLFIHSDNYYSSPISLNEMGAAWALRSNYTSILLPGFQFNKMKGVVNNSDISIKLDNDVIELKDKLNQLHNKIIEEFDIEKKPDIIWEQRRDTFIAEVTGTYIPKKEKLIGEDAIVMLKYAVADGSGEILKIKCLDGLIINAGGHTITEQDSPRESARWEAALDELLDTKMVKEAGGKGQVFTVSDAGYKYIDSLNEKRDV